MIQHPQYATIVAIDPRDAIYSRDEPGSWNCHQPSLLGERVLVYKGAYQRTDDPSCPQYGSWSGQMLASDSPQPHYFHSVYLWMED